MEKASTLKPESLNWEDIRTFLNVARCSSLSKAAKQLRIDTSTVSRRLSQFEYAVGFSLFERNPGGLQINDRGKRLLLRVEAMGEGFAGLISELEGGANDASGLVRIGTMEGLASLYLARHLPSMQTSLPTVILELVTSTQWLQVSRREADIFLGFFKPTGVGFDSELLCSFKLHLYASDGYLSARPTPSMHSLGEHHFIGYVDELIQIDAVRWLEEVMATPQMRFHSNSMIAQMFAAASGIGMVLLPEFSDAERFGLKKVLQEEVVVTRELWLSVHRELRYASRVKRVIACLRELFQNDRRFYR